MHPLSPPSPPPTIRPRQTLRVAMTLGSAALMLAVVAIVFWYQDARYSLPTPRPPALALAAVGEIICLPAGVDPAAGDDRPLLLHFFNPDCPCSRFNAEHIRALRLQFGGKIRFMAVVQIFDDGNTTQRRAGLAAASLMFGPQMEAVADDGGKIAAACGVYSTPQAAILAPGTAGHALLFRGNYNISRYCADPKTEFVRLALDALAGDQPVPPESAAAMVAYGCELPVNVAAAAALPKHSPAPAKL